MKKFSTSNSTAVFFNIRIDFLKSTQFLDLSTFTKHFYVFFWDNFILLTYS